MKLREKTLNECITIIDRELPAMIDECIKHFITAPYCEHSTWEQLVGDSENDSKQQTQAATKIIQNAINNCITHIIKDLPITKEDIGKGMDYKYVGNGQTIPLEVKCSGGKDGATACIGNLKVLDSKCEVTLVFRYTIEKDRVTEWQTVTIDGSARKWTEYNDQSGSSNFSALKCKTDVDFQDITVYSGDVKPNKTWVKFVKEAVC